MVTPCRTSGCLSAFLITVDETLKKFAPYSSDECIKHTLVTTGLSYISELISSTKIWIIVKNLGLTALFFEMAIFRGTESYLPDNKVP